MERNDLFEALLKFVSENETMESEYAGRMERWCFYCGAYLDTKGIEHKPGCLYSWVVAYLEARDKEVDRLVEEQRWKDADEADQILEQEALIRGFG